MTDQELIVALDRSGREYPIVKLTAHQHNIRHRAVSLFLFSDDCLLLQQRAPAKYHSGGLWSNSMCSHPRWGETLDACAKRRLEEELGLSVPIFRFSEVEYQTPVGDLFENEVVTIYSGSVNAKEQSVPFNPSEVGAIRWATIEETKTDVSKPNHEYSPWFHIYLRDHYDMLCSAKRACR